MISFNFLVLRRFTIVYLGHGVWHVTRADAREGTLQARNEASWKRVTH
jgi:hypothetical protein